MSLLSYSKLKLKKTNYLASAKNIPGEGLNYSVNSYL